MSNVGQAVLTIGGTIIGGMYGYPQLGFALGSLAGQAFFPTQLPTQRGPRLDDLSVQGSGVGIPVPIVYGSFRIAGNIIWSTDLIETTTSERVGGKGGPTQRVESTTYAVNFAVGLCEGPITGVRRIWAGGNLIYDRRAQLPDEDSTTYANRQTAANLFDQSATLYLGTEDQLPDPLIESYEGTGNVPGYRGLAYMVIENFQLADYGNNLTATALTFEVIRGGAIEFEDGTHYAPPYIVPFNADPQEPFSVDNDNQLQACMLRADGTATTFRTVSIVQSVAEAINLLITDGRTSIQGNPKAPDWPGYFPIGSKTYLSDGSHTTPEANISPTSVTTEESTANTYRVSTFYYPFPEAQIESFHVLEDIPGFTIEEKLAYLGANGVDEGEFCYIEGNPGDSQGLYLNNGVGTIVGLDPVWNWNNRTYLGDASDYIYFDGTNIWYRCDPLIVTGWRNPRQPSPPCNPRNPPHMTPPASPYDGLCDVDGTYYEEGVEWEQVNISDGTATVKILQAYDQREDYPEQVGPMLHVSHPDFNDQTFWEAQYAAAVVAGTMPTGLTYGTHYPSQVTENRYFSIELQQSFISTETMRLYVIVDDLCRRSGMDVAEYDASDLTQRIDGYAIGRISDAASAIQPLRLYGFFDAVESDGVLRFVLRGGDIVATLEVGDLAAHEAGSNRPSAVVVSRLQDIELPRVVRVKYAMVDKDYEPGEQQASRLLTTANQVVDLEIPVAMQDLVAAQIADISLYEAWQSRNTYSFAVSQKHMRLEPTDPILLPVDGGLQRVRLMSEDFSLPGVRHFKAVRDGGASGYLSFAVGAAPSVGGREFSLRDDTVAIYLDLPMLRDADNDAGYYVAMRQASSDGFWPGGSVLRSADDGATYSLVASATRQSVTGFVTACRVLGVPQLFVVPGGTETIEYNVEIEVTLDLDNMLLSSTTMAGILAGANAAVVGANGRWEIFQFLNAELLEDSGEGSVWLLTGLVRGRRGTDFVMNQVITEIGDRFVMLQHVVRANQELAVVGAARLVKAVTSGQSIDAVSPASFAGNGEALRPLSPVWLQGTRDLSGNATITWIRRSRFGQELPAGADIPLGEATEEYDLEVMDGDDVVRTVTVTSPEYEYTAADQTTDFGSPQDPVVVRVYQRSAAVGRGHPAQGNV